MGIVECKRMFLVIQRESNNTPRRDDLHPCPFSDITILLRKRGRGVPHPWPTVMLKLYSARLTLTFGTVWDLLRGRPFDFWAGGGGGMGYFIYIYIYIYIYISCRLILRRKNSWKEKLGEKNSRKICFMAYNAGKKSYPCCMSRKKVYPPRPNHTYPLKSQMVGPL